MANNKAVFYFNVINENGMIYSDLADRLNGWDRRISSFLGTEWELLIVPIVRGETKLTYLPTLPISDFSSKSILTEEQAASSLTPPNKKNPSKDGSAQ